MKIVRKDEENLDDIAAALKNGEILVLPTDTVYGLVCDAKNEKSVEKIFEIKNRDKSKPLPVFVNGIKMAKECADINSGQQEIIEKSWPGAITFVLKSKKIKSKLLTKDGTIALRQPNYEMILELIGVLGGPLAQTSANISGDLATTEIKKVLEQFQKEDITIIDAGNLPESKPSTIIDLTEDNIKILRK